MVLVIRNIIFRWKAIREVIRENRVNISSNKVIKDIGNDSRVGSKFIHIKNR
jgi:hypothetical protein